MDNKKQNPPTIDSYSSDNGELPIIDEQDAREMAKLGIKQRLRRNFGWLSILGFSCICMVGPLMPSKKKPKTVAG